jgi:hypothetical protein
LWLFCAEPCLLAVLNAESDKGQNKALLPPGPELQIGKLFQRGMWFELVATLDVIDDIIQTCHWGYLYNCAYIVLPILVREFYRHLEVVQDEDSGIALQSTEEHVFQIDPQVISRILGVPVLHISASHFTEVVEPHTLEQFREFFHAVPQGEEQAYMNIRINAFSPLHRLLVKIVQHNLWPIVRRSKLILKRTQFLYVIVMRLSFYLSKHILNIMLESRDEHTTGLPFICLVTKIILQSGIDISGEPEMKIPDPLGKQTLMKSNA